jgi:hypothetical protein
MIIKLYNISHLYEAGEIVFFKKELYKTSNELHQHILNGTVVAYDIFGNAMSANDAADQLLIMVDSPDVLTLTEAIYHNMEVGKQILALWREYVILKSTELGISGHGMTQLSNFYLIECALLAGMLWEASQMVLAMPCNEVITEYIKHRFSQACITADRLG